MDLRLLIEKLNGPVETDRLYAAEDLGEANDAVAVAALAGRLAAESSRAVKQAIFHAMGRVRDDAVIPTAVQLLSSDDAFVRNEAVRLLGDRGAASGPALAQAAVCDDSNVRKFALDALAPINSDLKEDVYRLALNDPDMNVVITAVEHIGRGEMMALREWVEAVLVEAKHPMLIAACVDTLTHIGNDDSLDAMYRMLGGETMPEFQAAEFIRAVGRLGVEAHLDLLGRLMNRFPATTVTAGLDAIEEIRRRVPLSEVSPALLATVRSIVAHDRSSLHRYEAVIVLGALSDRAARESITQYLGSEDKMVRLAAVESIAHWDCSAVVDLLAQRYAIGTSRFSPRTSTRICWPWYNGRGIRSDRSSSSRPNTVSGTYSVTAENTSSVPTRRRWWSSGI